MSARSQELERRLTVIFESFRGAAERAPERKYFEVWFEPGSAPRTLVAFGSTAVEAMDKASRWAHGLAVAVTEALRDMDSSGVLVPVACGCTGDTAIECTVGVLARHGYAPPLDRPLVPCGCSCHPKREGGAS